ncbi:MAG: zinc ribbon domain-containing protein [Dictyoglomaceae bacterium]
MRRESIPILLEIQDFVLRLKNIEKNLKSKEEEFQEFKKEKLQFINLKEKELKEIEKNIKDLKDKQREKEDKVILLKEKYEQEEKRVLLLKNPKEVLHVEKEIENLKNQIRNLEDEILNLMISLEEKNNYFLELERELRRIKEEVSIKEKEYMEEIENFKKEIQGIYSQIEERKKNIPSNDLSEFENLLRQKLNRAISRVVNREICEGCKLVIPKLVLEKLKRGEIVFCPNCGRILWME